jgi:hypothetical protein
MDVQTLTYHGTTTKGLEIQVDVSFLLGDEIMVNATEMAKPFGKHKQPGQWLKTRNIQEIIDSVTEVTKIISADLVKFKEDNKGVKWMN